LEPDPDNATRADERRLIARELHDSTSQLLVVLQLQLHQLSLIDHPDAGSLIDECQQTIREIRDQIRGLDAA
jgi:signal transduction histidine kinase